MNHFSVAILLTEIWVPDRQLRIDEQLRPDLILPLGVLRMPPKQPVLLQRLRVIGVQVRTIEKIVIRPVGDPIRILIGQRRPANPRINFGYQHGFELRSSELAHLDDDFSHLLHEAVRDLGRGSHPIWCCTWRLPCPPVQGGLRYLNAGFLQAGSCFGCIGSRDDTNCGHRGGTDLVALAILAPCVPMAA
eukprot:3561631-Prymnesium_polylepis.1